MELVVEDAGFGRKLTGNAGLVTQVAGPLSYRNIRLLHRAASARHVGATHEFLAVEGTVAPFDGIRFLAHADGGCRPETSERDVALLSAALAEVPADIRSLFYLAQTLREAGRLDEAIDAHRRRAAAGGFEEEAWYAQYALAGGALFALARHFRESGLHEAAMLFVEAGDRLPPSTPDILFLGDTDRREGFALEASISG